MTASFRPLYPRSAVLSRRRFLAQSGGLLLAPALFKTTPTRAGATAESPIALTGPGSKYVPQIHAAFVRRKDDYGMRWPGAVFDGAQALVDYRAELQQSTRDLGLHVRLRDLPIYSPAEADQWLSEAKADEPDGLLLMLLDRQEHAWPTAAKAIDTRIPTVIFAPVGAAFTTNTGPLASRSGAFICSTSDFAQAAFGLKMIKAAARLREMRYLVLSGEERRDTELAFFGTKLRYLPAQSFLDEYQLTATSDEIRAMAAAYLAGATAIRGATEDDVIRGIKSYVVARTLLEREEGDGITMDCLGALGASQVSLPCISWSKMLDQGVPAACEADLGACVMQALVQLLFDRPGFQQDPVPETARQCLIGAHCSCPTRLRGFRERPEPYDIVHHHGNRDAVPHPTWRLGEPVTIADMLLPGQNELLPAAAPPVPRLVIGTGKVADNVAVPPAGGCVVSVMVKLDTEPELLSYPGFHQLFFYGEFKRELLAYTRLFGIEPVVV